MNGKLLSLILHLPVWIIALFVADALTKDDFIVAPLSLSPVISTTLWFLASFYFFKSYLVPIYFKPGEYVFFSVYALLFVIIIIPVTIFTLTHITDIFGNIISDPSPNTNPYPWYEAIAGTFLWGILGSAYHFATQKFTGRTNREQSTTGKGH